MKDTPYTQRFSPTRLLGGLVAITALALTGTTAAAQAVLGPTPVPGRGLPDLVQADEALARLGGALDDVAQQFGVTPEELRSSLLDDPTLWVNTDNRLVFLDTPPAQRQAVPTGPVYSGSIPLEDAFTLHTNPGADKVIYLDFDGHWSKNNGWGHNIMFPPFNTSGSSGDFSDSELASIIAHWEYMAEDFAPFDADVTTEEPPPGYLTKTTFGDTTWGIRCVFTQQTDGFGNGTGGIALLGSFTDLKDTPCFAFNKGDNNGSMTGSHEVGHTFGLFHDGLFGSEYHPGTGSGATSWGPIMGAPFGDTVVHWSNGDYSGSTANQFDLGFLGMSSAGVKYLPDDYPDTVETAAELTYACPGPTFGTVAGVIGRTEDVDAFRFTTSGGVVTITADPFSPAPNLDIQLELYDGAGGLVASDNPTNATNASISQSVGAGSYRVLVEGVGKSGVYSDYGSVGQYTLTVTAPLPPTSLVDLGGALAGTGGTPSLVGTGFPCGGNTVTIDLTGALPGASAWLALGVGQLNAPFKGGTLVPDIGLGAFIPITIGGAGAVSLPLPWPPGIVAGVPLDFQYWIDDPGGIFGFAASNGLELISL